MHRNRRKRFRPKDGQERQARATVKARPLEIHLIPQPLWGQSLYRCLPKSKWNKLRLAAYEHAKYRCEACGKTPPKGGLCCHEEWAYDDERHVVSLDNLKAICRDCNAVAHAGRTGIVVPDFDIIGQLMKVNRWTRKEAEAHKKEAFGLWRERSRYHWRQDRSLEERYEQALKILERNHPYTPNARLAAPTATLKICDMLRF